MMLGVVWRHDVDWYHSNKMKTVGNSPPPPGFTKPIPFEA